MDLFEIWLSSLGMILVLIQKHACKSPPFLSFSLSSERVQILMRKFRSFSYQHFILRNINNVRSKALPGTKGASQALAAKGKHLKSGTSTGGGENGEGGGDKGSK